MYKRNSAVDPWLSPNDFLKKKPVRMIIIPNVTHSFLGGYVKIKMDDWEQLKKDIRNLL